MGGEVGEVVWVLVGKRVVSLVGVNREEEQGEEEEPVVSLFWKIREKEKLDS